MRNNHLKKPDGSVLRAILGQPSDDSSDSGECEDDDSDSGSEAMDEQTLEASWVDEVELSRSLEAAAVAAAVTEAAFERPLLEVGRRERVVRAVAEARRERDMAEAAAEFTAQFGAHVEAALERSHADAELAARTRADQVAMEVRRRTPRQPGLCTPNLPGIPSIESAP